MNCGSPPGVVERPLARPDRFVDIGESIPEGASEMEKYLGPLGDCMPHLLFGHVTSVLKVGGWWDA